MQIKSISQLVVTHCCLSVCLCIEDGSRRVRVWNRHTGRARTSKIWRFCSHECQEGSWLRFTTPKCYILGLASTSSLSKYTLRSGDLQPNRFLWIMKNLCTALTKRNESDSGPYLVTSRVVTVLLHFCSKTELSSRSQFLLLKWSLFPFKRSPFPDAGICNKSRILHPMPK